MKVAPIPPTELLREFSTRYHLCLAHILHSDAQQLAYYQGRAVAYDNYVILDNGAYECGRSVPFELVLEVATKVFPQEIVLPDVLLDSKETILTACEGHKLIRNFRHEWVFIDHPMNLMVAPQGKNLTEWLRCMDALINAMKPDTIGIPVVYEKMMGRGVLIREVIKYIGGDKFYQPEIHLLGWDGDLYKLNCYARDFPHWIRGIDSAKPFYYSLKRNPMLLDQGPVRPRPDNYFDLQEKDFEPDVLKQNVHLFEATASGSLAYL